MGKKERRYESNSEGHASVQVQNLNAGWTKESKLVLEDVSFSVVKNQLVGIVGPVGSGKVDNVLST